MQAISSPIWMLRRHGSARCKTPPRQGSRIGLTALTTIITEASSRAVSVRKPGVRNMNTGQVVSYAAHSNGMSKPKVDGLNAAMAQALSAPSNAGSVSPPQSQPAVGDKPTGMTEKIRRDATVLRNALAFTQVVGILMRSPHYRQYTLGDLEWLVIPPVMAGQFRIGEAKPNNSQGAAVPVAVVLWA